MGVKPDLPAVCVAIGCTDATQAEALALATCRSGETLLELRIDFLRQIELAPRIIESVLREHPQVTVLATCRRQPNGGRFAGSIQQQVDALQGAIRAGAWLVDVEIETLDEAPGTLAALPSGIAVLASYHNFECTPDLAPVVERLERTGAEILKVATTVERPSDNLRLMDLCRERSNMVVAGMGEAGLASRVLFPLRGGLFSYVTPDPDLCQASTDIAPTAPGQVSASLARERYRVAEATGATQAFAVIACPVAHSLSPLIHNRAFQAVDFDGVYIPQLVEPAHVGDYCQFMRSLPIRGASVTIPHKQAVMEFLDDIHPDADAVGAVNTLYWDHGRLAGTNTDVVGIIRPLEARTSLRGARVLVAGTGGAALAAVVAAKKCGGQVTVAGRSMAKTEALAAKHDADAMSLAESEDASFDVLVQATSVGMWPNVDQSLFGRRLPADLVFDLVYNPLETALMQRAKAEGKQVISGLEMFLEQAAEQFRIFTGHQAPRDVMRAAILESRVN